MGGSPDPVAAGRLRWFDGAAWTPHVCRPGPGGGTVTQAPLTPVTGGGTLLTEPVLCVTVAGPGALRVATPVGAHLADAVDTEGRRRRLHLSGADGGSIGSLERAGAGASATVVLRPAPAAVPGTGPTELGRIELTGVAGGAPLARLVARAALLGTAAVSPTGGEVRACDGQVVAHLTRGAGGWTTAIAHPLDRPLHALVAVLALAVELVPAD